MSNQKAHLDPRIQARVAAPEVFSQLNGLAHGHTQVGSKRTGAHAVQQPICKPLGMAALLRGDLRVAGNAAR
jgi:hypothetical protein